MARPPDKPDDPLDGLELIDGALESPPRQPDAPSVRDAAASEMDLSLPFKASAEPRWRCLNCGYLLPDALFPRCSECGRKYRRMDLESWDGYAEQWRFNRVQVMMTVALLTKLVALTPFAAWGRLVAALALLWACRTALLGKLHSTGGLYGLGGCVAAGVSIGLFLWWSDRLGHYLLETAAAALLVRAMLFDPTLGEVGATLMGRGMALAVAIAVPPAALFLYLADELGATSFAALFGPTGPPAWVLMYPPFEFAIPFAVSALWLLIAWWTLHRAQRVLFGRPQVSTAGENATEHDAASG